MPEATEPTSSAEPAKRNSSASKGHFTERRPVDPAAYELYLKGRQAWNTRTQSGFEEAIKYFEEAIRRDLEFALAYAGLSDTYSLSGLLGAGATGSRAAEAKDPDLVSTASVAYRRAGDRARSDALLQSLLSRRPLPAVPLSKWYALTDNKRGRLPDARTRNCQRDVAAAAQIRSCLRRDAR